MPVDVNISQPWMLSASVCQFLTRCQSPTGGFGGGPGQHAHLAPTYAAVNALCILGTEEAYKVINRFHVCFVLSPVYLQMLCGLYCHSNTFCLPPPPSERSSWTSCTLWSSQMAPLWCMWAGRWTSGELCHRVCNIPWSIFTTAIHLFILHVLMLLYSGIFQEWTFTVPNRQISARKILYVHHRSVLILQAFSLTLIM